jgi:hypothetical protein
VYFLVPFYAIMMLMLFYLRPRWVGAALISILAAVLLVPNLWHAAFPQLPESFIMEKPSISLNNLNKELTDLSDYARKNTPPDAIFLVDPDMGIFRLAAERALIVDWKSFPLNDVAMVEWQQRMFDCYGVPTRMGFAARDEMSNKYERISDIKLMSLHLKYGLNYAVLHRPTKTQYHILFSTNNYKIVQIK